MAFKTSIFGEIERATAERSRYATQYPDLLAFCLSSV